MTDAELGKHLEALGLRSPWIGHAVIAGQLDERREVLAKVVRSVVGELLETELRRIGRKIFEDDGK